MKISELTAALVALWAKHGDLHVKGVFCDMPGAGFGVPEDIDSVYRSREGWVAVDLDGVAREEWEHPDDVDATEDDATPEDETPPGTSAKIVTMSRRAFESRRERLTLRSLLTIHLRDPESGVLLRYVDVPVVGLTEELVNVDLLMASSVTPVLEVACTSETTTGRTADAADQTPT